MSVSRVLEKLDLFPEKEVVSHLKEETKKFVESLKTEINKEQIEAEVFVGGSFAKGTLIKKEEFDVDVFVRFDWKIERISEILEKVLRKICKKNEIKKVHGSRDYFQIKKGKNIIFEIVPVGKISKPCEMRNVTDLSYFHVNYVRKRLVKDMGREVVLAKAFCRAQNVYGAESYIHGFSGYGLECLIINYKTFEKMLRELAKVKGRLILDPEKKFKKKEDVLFEINESKLQSPIILVDPTWKERNVLAALSKETFEKFQKAAKEFLKNPSEKFFMHKKIDKKELESSARKAKAELVHIKLKTDRQEGDIAGSKLRKFAEFLAFEIAKQFEVKAKEFEYDESKSGDLYLILKSKGEIVRVGPPLKLKEHAAAFKKANKNTFVKNGILQAKIKVNYSAKKFAEKLKKELSSKMKEMSITHFEIV